MEFTIQRINLIAVTVLSVLLLPVLGLMFFVPVVDASPSIVQQNNAHSVGSSSNALAFTSSVTSGDVVVVGILTYSGAVTVSSVTDSRSSSYTQAITDSTGGSADTAAIYYATLSSSGLDTVTVTVTATQTFDMYIFEVSGVTATGVTTGLGNGSGLATATSSTSFVPPAFVLGVIGTEDVPPSSLHAGTGFTPVAPPSGDQFSFVEYSTSVSSPTTFPATISSPGNNWVEVGATFPALAPPPIPEYPIGLSILAIFMVIGYGLIRRKTVTKQK